MFKIELEVN